MDILTASDVVSAYMLRNNATLKSQLNVDLVVLALNNAKKFAQRRHDFELCKVSVDVSVSPLPTGGALTSAVEHGTSTVVSVKRIERAMIANDDGEYYPIHLASRSEINSIVQTAIDVGTVDLSDTVVSSGSDSPWLVQQGTKIYFYPDVSMATTTVLDVIKWLTDYGIPQSGTASSTSAGNLVDSTATFVTDGVVIGSIVYNTTDGTSATVTAVTNETTLALSANIFASGEAYTVDTGVTTDFMMDHCFDFLLYRSINELNFFLKDDQRVAISQAKLQEAWDSVLAWDANMIAETGEE